MKYNVKVGCTVYICLMNKNNFTAILDDVKLWDDFKVDKPYALPKIYHDNIQYLFRYGKKFTSNQEVIKDSIQELFYDLIRTRKNLGFTDNIRFYLFKSLKRILIRESVEFSKKLDKYEYDEEANFRTVFSSEDELIDQEDEVRNKNLIITALKILSPKQQEILYYKYNCNFEYDQICEIMSMNYDSARKMMYRALKSLGKAFEEIGYKRQIS